MTDSPFEELVKSLFETTKRADTALAELRVIATQINAKYKPRAQFNRWRDSEEGKLWKQEQHQAQGAAVLLQMWKTHSIKRFSH
jgi:hypothetical protein